MSLPGLPKVAYALIKVAYALTDEQLRRPARRRIDELAPVDDARVARMRAAEDGLAAIARHVDRLGRRREG
jgi:hypothetical protein